MTAAAHPSRHRTLSGIGLTLLAVLCFASLDSCVKHLSGFLPMLVVVWVRYALQALIMGVWLGWRAGGRHFRVKHPRFQVLRGALLLSTSALAFYGLKYMPMAEFTSVVMLAPVLVTLMAPFLLGEHVSPARWALVILALAGALIIVRPGSGLFGAAALFPLLVALASAGFQVLTSRMSSLESPMTTHFYTGAVGTVLMSGALLVSPVELAPVLTQASAGQWGLMVLAGVFGTLGHLAFIHALGRAPMGVLMPFTYAQIAFAATLGGIFFAHVPDSWALIGMGVIAASGATSVWLNTRAAPHHRAPASVVAADTMAE